MKPNMPLVWLLLVVDVAVSSLGSVFAKRNTTAWTLVALATYTLSSLIWICTLRAGAGQLARMGTLCDLSNCLAVILLGVVFYQEALSQRHAIGLVVALAGIVLLGGGE